jgi:hypothetical protein
LERRPVKIFEIFNHITKTFVFIAQMEQTAADDDALVVVSAALAAAEVVSLHPQFARGAVSRSNIEFNHSKPSSLIGPTRFKEAKKYSLAF